MIINRIQLPQKNRALARLLTSVLMLFACTAAIHGQTGSGSMYVCFYSAPIYKSMEIMYDVYQGIAKSDDNGGTWKSLAYRTSLMNDVTLLPETGALFAASEYGVLRSLDGGESWKQLNGWDIRTVFRVAFLGEDIWIATPQGPWVSRDGGGTWNRMTNGLQPLNATYTSDINVSGSTLLISTADGLYSSSNNGTLWTPSGLNDIQVDHIIRHPVNTTTIVATSYGNGIWISHDNGKNWADITGDLYSKKIQAFAFDPNDLKTMYTGMSDFPVCKSTDGGATWKSINRGMTINNITALTVDSEDSSTIYAGTENGLWVSKDAGQEWKPSTIRFGYIRSIQFARPK